MSPKDIFVCLFRVPFIVIAPTSISSRFMNFPNILKVLDIFNFSLFRMRDKEGVVGISGGMGLRLEEGIEVPE